MFQKSEDWEVLLFKDTKNITKITKSKIIPYQLKMGSFYTQVSLSLSLSLYIYIYIYIYRERERERERPECKN